MANAKEIEIVNSLRNQGYTPNQIIGAVRQHRHNIKVAAEQAANKTSASTSTNPPEEDLQIEQDAIDQEFWKDYSYVNPGVDEVGYNKNYSTGTSVPLSREQYEKRINPVTNREQWAWVNPSNPNDIDYTLDEKSINQLNKELEADKLEIKKEEEGDDIIKFHKERLELEEKKSRLLEELNVNQETLNTYEEQKLENFRDKTAPPWKKSEFYNEDYERLIELNTEISKNEKKKEAQKSLSEEKREKEARQSGYENMPTVTEALIGKDDRNSVHDFNKKYSKYGFTFAVDGSEGDYITVTSSRAGKDGTKTKRFSVDHFYDWIQKANNKHTDKSQATAVDAWMRERAVDYGTRGEGFYENVLGSFDPKDYKNDISNTLYDDITTLHDNENYIPVNAATDIDSEINRYNTQVQYINPSEANMSQTANMGYEGQAEGAEPLFVDTKTKREVGTSTIPEKITDAIKEETRRRWLEANPGKDLPDRLGKEMKYYGYETSDIPEANEVASEWEELLASGDEEKIKNSAIFRSISNLQHLENRQAMVEAKVANIADRMGGSDDLLITTGQETVLESLEESLEGATDERKSTERKLLVCQEIFKEIEGDGKRVDGKFSGTTGMAYEANWIMENQGRIKDKIAKIQNRTFATQEDVDKANFDIQTLVSEYQGHLDKYTSYKNDYATVQATAKKIHEELPNVIGKEMDLTLMVNTMGMDYDLSTAAWDALGNASIDLAMGIATFGDMVIGGAGHAVGLGLNYAVDSGVITNPVISTYTKAVASNLNNNRFDNDAGTTSWFQEKSIAVDKWQEETTAAKNIAPPIEFDGIGSFADAGEWAVTTLASQAPQLVLLAATAGQSAWISSGAMFASASGQKFNTMEEQDRQFFLTDGAYGQDFDMGSMLFTSLGVGAAEVVSERFTLGRMKAIKNSFNTTGIRNGGLKYLRREVFSRAALGNTIKSFTNESISEGLATLSENGLDILSGATNPDGTPINIFDNVAESMVTGALINGAISSPMIYTHMANTFTTPDNQSIMNSNLQEINDITKTLSTDKSLSLEQIKAHEARIEDLLTDSKARMEQDIKRVDVLDDSQKTELINIQNESRKLNRAYSEIVGNDNMSKDQKIKEIAKLQTKLDKGNVRKQEILDTVAPTVANAKYDKMMSDLDAQVEEIQAETDLKINVTEGGVNDMAEWQAEGKGHYKVEKVDDPTGAKDKDGNIKKVATGKVKLTKGGVKFEIQNQENTLNDPYATSKEKAVAKRNLEILKQSQGGDITMSTEQWNQIKGASNSYGAMAPVLDPETGELKGFDMFINKTMVYKDGKFNTAAHELLHGMLYQTLKQDVATQEALTGTLLSTLKSSGVKIDAQTLATIEDYSRQEGRAEEIMTLISEAVLDKRIKFPKSAISRIKTFFNNWSKEKINGAEIEFNTDEDVINFIKEYTNSQRNGTLNKRLVRMMESGVGGKLIEKAQRHRDLRKKFRPTKGQVNFSKNVDQTLRNNPDLLTEVDGFVKNENGSPKYTDKSTWQTSTDFVDAYTMVTQSNKLDGMIKSGMVAEGVNTPEALNDFTRKVKDELGERLLKNFDPAKNDSLFGWLTGVSGGAGQSIIYRAKGDVMVKYSKELKTTSIDRGITTAEGDTFSSQLEGEIDPELTKFETEDLTIGGNVVKKSDVDIIYLESVSADKGIVRSINNIVKDSGVNLEGLTYNGTKKNIVQHDGGKPKSKRKPTGSLYKVLETISGQFGVDPMRIIKEQDLSKSQRTIAREYIGKHAKKLIDMLPEGENRSGDATGVANTVLGEFYIKGERISMAESATGKGKASQTKRDDITVKEFTEFFNKPGTKSDGAIRALITQAATISANQAIRLNAISKATDPISTIALVGDGKSAIMFSKAPSVKNLSQLPGTQDINTTISKIGNFDRMFNRRHGVESTLEFWNRIPNFTTFIKGFDAEKGIYKNAIKASLKEAYGDFPPIIDNLDGSINEVNNMVGGVDAEFNNPPEAKLENQTESDLLLSTQKDWKQIVLDGNQQPINMNTPEGKIVFGKWVVNEPSKLLPKDVFFKSGTFDGSSKEVINEKGERVRVGKNNLLNANNKQTRAMFPKGHEFAPDDVDISNALTKPKQNKKNLKDKEGKASRTRGAKKILGVLNQMIQDNKANIPHVAALLSSTSSNQGHFMRKFSLMEFLNTLNEANVEEHTQAASDFGKFVLNRMIEGNYDLHIDLALNAYLQGSLPTRFDNLLKDPNGKFNYKNDAGKYTYAILVEGKPVWLRYFNPDVNNNQGGINPNVLILANGNTVAQEYGVGVDKSLHNSESVIPIQQALLFDVLNGNITQAEASVQMEAHVNVDGLILKNRDANISFSKAVNQANATNENTPSRGMSAFDFDETVGISDNYVIARRPIDKKVTKADLKTFSNEELVKLADALKDPEYLRPLQNVANEFYFESANRNDLTNAIIKHLGTNYGKPKALRDMTEAQVVKIAELMKDPEYLRPVQNKLNEFHFESANLNDLIKAIEVQRNKKYSKGINKILDIVIESKEEQKIASNEWPFVGETMVNEGWEMDFTDFDKVTKGRPGPLMDKLKNRIKKFGPENNYILTARAAESEVNIHAYLKSEGIEIPLENITGLGNSTGAAKAQWIVEKFSEGYNDIYFVDDALPNVQAVKDVMDQLDIKGSSVQAKIQFSKRISPEFNNVLNGNVQTELDLNRILEQTKGVKAESRYSDAQAKVRGSKKGKWGFFVPPSAEDFKGLIYRFIAKGKIGEQQMAFFKKALFDPFSRANEAMNGSKQRLEGEYRALLKEFPNIKSDLNKTVGKTNLTNQQAVRVYLWNKAGLEIPGISKRDLDTLVNHVEGDADLKAFADSLGIISNQEAGYTQPGDFWMVENIQSDINKINNEISRADHLAEWKQNIESMFGTWENGKLVGPNINKIEAIYGSKFREALEDIVWRMEFGTKRQTGNNRLVNAFNNWANQSVGAIMFFNMRSALLQTISSINYLNWSDNNPLRAGMALANVPQFIKDFSMIFNSDMLKQRRAGNQRGINEAELAEAVAGNKFSPKAIINWLLTKGFLPTQIADSFAIASGGATFYRNRVNSLMKQGLTQQEAEARAFQDFADTTEESQQSSRPDMISQQQASPLGRYILAFKNTPMQYMRLTKKAYLDLVNGRGDAKTNVGKIIYYMGVQNLIFSGLQAALGAMIGDDDEEKNAKAYERVANSMVDSVLGGLGFAGNAAATLKNMILEYNKQEKKGWNADHTYTILKFFSFSPTIGSKGRKLYSAIQTQKYNEEVIKEMGLLDIDNPRHSVIANLVSALTNVPLDRLVKKVDNVDAAITEDITALQRFALLMGWNTWDLDVDDSDVVAVEDEIKKKKEVEKEEKKKIKKEEKKKEKEIENKAKEEENKKKKDGGCIAISKSGARCKNEAEVNGYCTIHAKVEQGTKEVRCKKIKSDKKRCGMMTKAKSGYCYYHD